MISIVSLTAINFQHAILRSFVCDIGDRITYFYGTGIRKISLNVLAERSFIFSGRFPSKRYLHPKQGRAYEYKNLCRGLPSADTLGTIARAETARSFARSWPAIVVRKFPNNLGPPGHWYYVVNGTVRRCAPCVRAAGGRSLI